MELRVSRPTGSHASNKLAISEASKKSKVLIESISEDEDYFDDEDEKKTSKPNEDYVAMLEHLWLNPENHINIYSVEYEQEKDLSNKNEGTFAVKELKAFDHPKGAFILVESKFNPPEL